MNHVALNLKPTGRDALVLLQSRTEVFIHRRAVTCAGCMTGRNGSTAEIHLPASSDMTNTTADLRARLFASDPANLAVAAIRDTA